jgi:hypothetical protein
MEKICPCCNEPYQTSWSNQIACHKLQCKTQYTAQHLKENQLKRLGRYTGKEDLEDIDRSSFMGFYTYMKMRPFYFQDLSSMTPTPEHIKEFYYESL